MDGNRFRAHREVTEVTNAAHGTERWEANDVRGFTAGDS